MPAALPDSTAATPVESTEALAVPTPRRDPFAKLKKLVNPPRIVGLDVARALAILGMMAAHMGVAPELVWADPSTWGGICHGAPAILFAFLAGISFALMSGGQRMPAAEELPTIRLKLLVRAAVIFAIGVLLEMLGTWVAVILPSFAVFYGALLPALNWKPRKLAGWAVGIALVGPALSSILGNFSLQTGGAGLSLAIFGLYSLTTWLPMMMLGLAVGRLGVSRARVQGVMIGAGAASMAVSLGIAAVAMAVLGPLGSGSSPLGGSSLDASDSILSSGSGSDSNSWFTKYCAMSPDERAAAFASSGGTVPSDSLANGPGVTDGWAGMIEQFPPDVVSGEAMLRFLEIAPHSGGTLEMLHLGGFAAIVTGLCLLVGSRLKWVLAPLSALGSMPLTSYSIHVLVIWAIAGPMGFVQDNLIYAVTAFSLMIACLLWAMWRGQGPLERLTATLARKAAGAAVSRPAH